VNLDPIDAAGLDVPTRLPDLRRDIHVFVDYVRSRDVKRSHRGNMLGKTDVKRLANLMSDPAAAEEAEGSGTSRWVDFVDGVVLQLGFVKYDTKGIYAGYTSSAPSFPDNYIEFLEQPYNQFLRLTAAKQESALLKLLVEEGQGNGNEFYRTSIVGRLDRFDHFGSATGVMPLLDFAAARRFLLGLLAKCPTGQWLSAAALVKYLKKNHPYFLIPQKPRFENQWHAQRGRYGNFHESKERWGREITVAENAGDAFERVEGRYVERFLEGIPLLLRYVDVAYVPKRSQAIYPSLGWLQAFRVSERLRHALQGEVPEPQVKVTPNFDVYVQGETYPAGVLPVLTPLCETVSEGTSTVLKMTKPKVAAARAADPQLDVVALLRRLCQTELPSNVVRELSAWAEHGEKFVLYSDAAVLEADKDLQAAAPYTVEAMAPGILLVRSPDKLFGELERQELVPLRVKHGERAFSPLPKEARTRFPKTAAVREKPRAKKPRITLTRVTRVQLVCPDREFLNKLQRCLVEAKCPVEADREKLMLLYSKAHEAEVTKAVRALKGEYLIEIKDVG
jgi:hypothetical protein